MLEGVKNLDVYSRVAPRSGVELIPSIHAPAAAHLAHTQALPLAQSGT